MFVMVVGARVHVCASACCRLCATLWTPPPLSPLSTHTPPQVGWNVLDLVVVGTSLVGVFYSSTPGWSSVRVNKHKIHTYKWSQS